MHQFKVGDRVRLAAAEGRVEYVNGGAEAVVADTVDVQFDGRGYVTEYVPVELLEYLPPAPKIGDTLDAAQLDALPARSVVVDRDGHAWVKVRDKWSLPIAKKATCTAEHCAHYRPRLVHIGN